MLPGHTGCMFWSRGDWELQSKVGVKGREPWGETEMAMVGGALDDHLYTAL